MKKRLYVDIDGILVDYKTAFFKWKGLDPSKYSQPRFNFFSTGAWESSEAVIEDIIKFADTPEWSNLEPIALGLNLEAISNMGVEIHAITHGSGTTAQRFERLMMLTYLFDGVFTDVHFVHFDVNKGDYIAKLYYNQDPGSVWSDHEVVGIVEDSPSNMEHCSDKGIHVFAVRYEYNKYYEDKNPAKTDWFDTTDDALRHIAWLMIRKQKDKQESE